ncbi:reverse transcriptase [Lasius niger]|uniref:Reverse transcriptase n=1 Tax=Lasius niger TaxID=67767 RepID=A0A0J7KVY4_LASNI|nr:reverse transcriptase [Lasius niger]
MGIRQGDPLSPIIFNVVTYRMLKKLLDKIGVRLGGIPINAAALAYDLLLFAATPKGLQELINIVTRYLAECGMTINLVKSMTIAVRAASHIKKTAIDGNTTFRCDGRLSCLTRSTKWRYLGMYITPEGRTRCRPAQILEPIFDSLPRATLKPQQRVFALRTMVVPKLYHQLALV